MLKPSLTGGQHQHEVNGASSVAVYQLLSICRLKMYLARSSWHEFAFDFIRERFLPLVCASLCCGPFVPFFDFSLPALQSSHPSLLCRQGSRQNLDGGSQPERVRGIKYRIRLGKAGQTNLCHLFCNLCHFRQLVSFFAQV